MEGAPHEGGEPQDTEVHLVLPPEESWAERERIEHEHQQRFGAVAVGREAQEDEPDNQDDAADPFGWGDAARWSPAEAAADEVKERRFSADELEALFGDGADDDIGSADELGWYGLVRRQDRPGGFILMQDEQGFRHVRETETDEALEQAWQAIQREYETYYEERDAYELVIADAEGSNNPGPRIWVASLADYTAGRLYGVWMDATCEPYELAAATRFMLRGSQKAGAEEWGIFDHDGFASYQVGEYESFATVSRIANGIAEHGEAFAAWVSYVGAEDEELLSDERFQDHYFGHFDSTRAYVENLLEETGDYEYLDRLPEHLKPYVSIDTELMARDYESGLYVVEAQNGGVFVFDTRT